MPPVVFLVHDGEKTEAPEAMGKAREDQLRGSRLDVLSELAGRVSYDSLGRGRNSEEFHANIKAKRHHNIYRHCTMTFCVDASRVQWPPDHLWVLANRPGVYLTDYDGGILTFVANLQAVLEWNKRVPLNPTATKTSEGLGRLCRSSFYETAPLATGTAHAPLREDRLLNPGFAVLSPMTDHEIYASVFLADISRVAMDELARHFWECAISAESTRYVDMSKRAWMPHPLFRTEGKDYAWCLEQFRKIEFYCRSFYNSMAITLGKIGDPASTTSVKTLRGAVRGVLGLSVGTRLIFTASLSAWKEIFRQRVSEHADEEIREAATMIHEVLTRKWPQHFAKEE